MITMNKYRSFLSTSGDTLGEIRKKQSENIINQTFTNDPTYRKVRVLTKDGWVEEDAKYQFHVSVTISKDAVDFYLQFRPHVHYPVGTYVIVPKENDDYLSTYEEEFKRFDNGSNLQASIKNQLWMIVARNDSNMFIRHNILKCNWKLQWIYNGEILSCLACLRNANSYTSGAWTGDYATTLDNLTSIWLPDLHAIYGDRIKELGLDDNRTIGYEQRFMLTNNQLFPRCYSVTKVLDTAPQGLIKLSLKQDEFNPKRDNVDLKICDYYVNSGNTVPDEPMHIDPDVIEIIQMEINSDNELIDIGKIKSLQIGISKRYYLSCRGWSGSDSPYWRIKLNSDSLDELHPSSYYENLIHIEKIDIYTVRIWTSKASSLYGKNFTLCVCDSDGYAHSTLELGVREDAT